jgi:RES domain-containing protein
MITAWRLCNKLFAEPIGEGARICRGRWNPIGYAVVNSSECLPLANLEALVHTRRRPNDQVYIQVSFEKSLVQEVESLFFTAGRLEPGRTSYTKDRRQTISTTGFCIR